MFSAENILLIKLGKWHQGKLVAYLYYSSTVISISFFLTFDRKLEVGTEDTSDNPTA